MDGVRIAMPVAPKVRPGGQCKIIFYVHCMTLRQHGPRCGHHGRMGEARHRGRMDGLALGICTVCSTSTPNDHGRHRFPRMGLRDVRPGQPQGIRIRRSFDEHPPGLAVVGLMVVDRSR